MVCLGCAGDGFAVEAVLRFRKLQETEDRDAGRLAASQSDGAQIMVFFCGRAAWSPGQCVKWDAVMQHFNNDVLQANRFAARRRCEQHGRLA